MCWTDNRSAPEPATRAGRPWRSVPGAHRAESEDATLAPPAILIPPVEMAVPVWSVPTRTLGRVGPMDRARIGSVPVPSSQRPNHPTLTDVAGEAVCQMSIERKWLSTGFG